MRHECMIAVIHCDIAGCLSVCFYVEPWIVNRREAQKNVSKFVDLTNSSTEADDEAIVTIQHRVLEGFRVAFEEYRPEKFSVWFIHFDTAGCSIGFFSHKNDFGRLCDRHFECAGDILYEFRCWIICLKNTEWHFPYAAIRWIADVETVRFLTTDDVHWCSQGLGFNLSDEVKRGTSMVHANSIVFLKYCIQLWFENSHALQCVRVTHCLFSLTTDQYITTLVSCLQTCNIEPINRDSWYYSFKSTLTTWYDKIFQVSVKFHVCDVSN